MPDLLFILNQLHIMLTVSVLQDKFIFTYVTNTRNLLGLFIFTELVNSFLLIS